MIKKEGYRDIRPDLIREVKVGNAVIGVFNWFALMWVYGPKKTQYVLLTPEE